MANYVYTEATKQVKASAGKIKSVFVSAASGTPTITIYDTSDGTTTNTTLIGTFTPTAATCYVFSGDEGGAFFNKGLYVVVGGTVHATVLYE
jgi:hypothetical protein